MNNLHEGDIVKITSYKHNGSLNRRWEKNTILAVNDTHIIGMNDRTTVTDKTGQEIQTVFPALFYFNMQEWFNVIYNFVPHQAFFYCNIGSPPKIAEKTIQYIDYDIDVIVHPDFTYNIKDLDEYEENQQFYRYSIEVKNNVEQAMEQMKKYIEERKVPFRTDFIQKWTNKMEK